MAVGLVDEGTRVKRPVVLAAYRACAERRENWAQAKPFWERLGIPIVTGDKRGVFGCAAARNAAARKAGDWDVALIVDTDIVLAHVWQAEAALQTAWLTGRYTVAHSRLVYLPGTEEAQTWESAVAVRRDLWDEVGGLDERFVGYGHQGVAFFAACGTLAGRERIEGTAFHLPHAWENRNHPHFAANSALADRYAAAAGDPAAMRALLAEPR